MYIPVFLNSLKDHRVMSEPCRFLDSDLCATTSEEAGEA